MLEITRIIASRHVRSLTQLSNTLSIYQNINEIVFANSHFERGSQGALGRSGYQLAVSRLASACKARCMLATGDYHWNWYYGLSRKISRVSDTYSSVSSSSPASSRSTLRSLSAMRSRGEWNMSIIRRRPRPIDIWDAVNLRSQLVCCFLSEIFIHTHVLDLDCATAAWASRASYLRFHPAALSGSGELVSWRKDMLQSWSWRWLGLCMLEWTSRSYNPQQVDDTWRILWVI